MRTVHRMATATMGAGLVLASCSTEEPTRGLRSAAPEPVVDGALTPEEPETDLRLVHGDPPPDADLERYCRAHDAALHEIDALLADDPSEDDAVEVLLGSLEAVTSTLAADLRAAESSLHPRVEPLVAAAEETAAGAREALDANHDARHAYLAEQLAGASYLQQLVYDPTLYATVTSLGACEDLPLGAVTAELRDADDHDR